MVFNLVSNNEVFFYSNVKVLKKLKKNIKKFAIGKYYAYICISNKAKGFIEITKI